MTVAKRKFDGGAGLLHSRYSELASNTIDYWMLPDDRSMNEARLNQAIGNAPVFPNSTLQLYLHVPFCAQRCRFCAFSGGNALDFKQAERYVKLVVTQTQDLLSQTQIQGRAVKSVNIGGGSPDLVGTHIRHLLTAVRDLPGVTDQTEISVEFTLSTVTEEFINALADFYVTKASFGVQSLDPTVRHNMRQPKRVIHLDRVLNWIDGRIPVVNADLITGMPGQDLSIALNDQKQLMADSRINAVSSYVLTAGAAPALIAAMETGKIPPMPAASEQALMRLHSYATFLREGWIRRGTNTYVDPSQIPSEVVSMIAGNECIGASHYEDFLIGVGPQAISFMPGVRAENLVDIKAWAQAIDNGTSPFHIAKCSDVHQYDTALWVFPLRWEGLERSHFDALVQNNRLSDEQLQLWNQFVKEGLIVESNSQFRLSIRGEVFMGRLVRDLKQAEGQHAVDQYIAEGHSIGKAIAEGRLDDENAVNNRQPLSLEFPETQEPPRSQH